VNGKLASLWRERKDLFFSLSLHWHTHTQDLLFVPFFLVTYSLLSFSLRRRSFYFFFSFHLLLLLLSCLSAQSPGTPELAGFNGSNGSVCSLNQSNVVVVRRLPPPHPRPPDNSETPKQQFIFSSFIYH
jgi:hypothetical protein